ncbi:MAG: DUF115 domain-containing protein [Candidatus Gastranaerophilales bacterium]|nr:DUF115 domain-containing protein [Candidatus Gastranaerophilales bacterium]
MLEQNIKELEKRNPELAAKISAHTEIKDIEVFESESKNFIISHKGILLHSNEDPLRESKAVWFKTVKNDLKETDIQVIYGLGLGYLFKRAYVNAPSRILVYEPSLDILRFVFENVDFVNEIADERVFFAQTEEEAISYFEKKYFPGDKVEVLFLPSYLNFGQDILLKFSGNIYKVVKDKNIDHNTVLTFAKPTTVNLIQRTKNIEKYKPVEMLQDKAQGKPAIILSAGPSLLDDIAKIKESQDKFIKIAILPAVSTLAKNGIKPDFVVVADSLNQMHKISQDQETLKDINLVIESRADISMDSLETKNKFIYFSFVDRISNEIINNLTKEKITQHQAVPSVVLLGFELAKILGCKDIIFSGMDLALTGGKAYASDDTKAEFDKKENMVIIKNKIGAYATKTTTVTSADGKQITSREDYMLFAREFEKLINSNPEINFVNTALKGALINGMTYLSIDEAIKLSKETAINIDEILKTADNKALKEYKQIAEKILSSEKELYSENKATIDSAILATQGMITELSLDKPNIENFQKLFNHNVETCSKVRSLCSQDLVLSTYMQAEVTDFISNYHKETQMTLEKLLGNLNLDLALFEKTKESVDVLVDIL